MNLLSFLMRTSKDKVILATGISLLGGVGSAVFIALINTTLSTSGAASQALVWSFVLLCIFLLVTRFASHVLLLRLSQESLLNLRMQLSRQILYSPFRQLEELGAHRLLTTLTHDVSALSTTLAGIPIVCVNITIVLTCFAYLCWLSWPVFLAVLVMTVVGMLSYKAQTKKAGRSLKCAREEHESLFQQFQALTGGIKELQLNSDRREAFLAHNLKPTISACLHHNIIAMTTYAAAGLWRYLLLFTLIGFALFVLPSFPSMSTHIITGYTLTLLYMMAPLEYLLLWFPGLGQAQAALHRIEELGLSLAEPIDTNDTTLRLDSFPALDCLELRNVTYTYGNGQENSDFRLGPVDEIFLPGQLIFLVGGNGSGKTTLAKLLVGLYAPESGEIRLNGTPITAKNREWYRQYFSTIFSDFYLFETLLGFTLPDLDIQAQDYLSQLQLDSYVQVNNGVLSTTALSHGQRKRLALLTAYLEDRPFYVFDEWAADQDPFFREIFYTQLLPELKHKGKAIFVITHDERYYHLADRIIKLDYGKTEYDEHIYVEQLVDLPQAESAG